MKIGYARVSTDTQTTQQQEQALAAAGCERVFVETTSGGKWERVELHRLLDQLKAGDTVVVWKLDRFSRSLRDLLQLLAQLEGLGVGLKPHRIHRHHLCRHQRGCRSSAPSLSLNAISSKNR